MLFLQSLSYLLDDKRPGAPRRRAAYSHGLVRNKILFHNHVACPSGHCTIYALNGLKERYGEVTPKLKERLDYELSIIIQMGFVDYFLIVWDFIKYAKDNGISVGPGRGSAAGSIVAYSLRITDIDPIKYDLIFERFLNPERVSMPDIDIDFCYERRGEVIDYVRRKYGNDQVVQIVTFGTMAARNAIRDVGRALNIPYADVDRVAKMVPQELHITIEKALVKNPEFKEIYDTDPTVKHLIDMSMKLEGFLDTLLPTQHGVIYFLKFLDF